MVTSYKNLSVVEILTQILENQEQVSTQVYKEYFDTDLLRNIECKIRLQRGEQLSNVNDILNDCQLKELNNQKILKFCDKNKKQFKNDEKIELNLILKNIPELNVRVFEVNTENFIKRHQNQDFDKIKVDCLIPSEEYSYTFDKSAMVKHEYKLDFPSIQSKTKGVFIIDLIGGEVNSKAIIQKGQLTLIYDKITGRNCVIIDENNEIQKTDNSGVYIENKFFKACPNTGVIQLGTQIKTYDSKQVQLVVDGFSVLSTIQMRDLSYSLRIKPLFNVEEVIAGRQVNIIVKADLTVNNRPLTLEKLQQCKLTISSYNFQGIQQKKEYKNITLNDQKDLVVQYIVPAKLKSINIELSGELESAQGKENLVDCQEYLFSYTQLFKECDHDFYQNSKGEYIFSIFGHNGEPITNEKVNIKLESNKFEQQKSYDLITDSKGTVNLGNLSDFDKVVVKSASINVSFKLSLEVSQKLPNIIRILENDTYTIDNPYNYQLISFDSFSDKSVNLEQCIELKNNKILLKNLKYGIYSLYLENDTNISIQVEKGQKLELNGKNIINGDEISTLEQLQEGLDAYVVKTENEICSVKLTGNPENVKVHLLLSNYLINTEKIQIYDFLQNSTATPNSITYKKNQVKNKFYSDGRLDDELVYVHNRKKKKNYMGNTLEKPGMILKRKKVKETTEDDEKIEKGKMAKSRAGRCPSNRLMEKKCGVKYDRSRQVPRAEQLIREFLINDPNEPQMLIPNLEVQNDTINIALQPFQQYNNVYLVGHNYHGQFMLQLKGSCEERNTNDLRQETQRQKGSILRYDRSMDYLQKGVQIKIPHISKQEVSFIEDMRDLQSVCGLLSGQQRNEWVFLGNWQNISDEEKLKKYDKYCCNELNLYLYMKDEEFFTEVVKPFINNKKEKQLVDYFLLGNQEKLDMYKKSYQIDQLSSLELILLMQYYVEKDSEFSETIFRRIKDRQFLSKYNVDLKKRQFDSILASQKQDDQFKDDETSMEEDDMDVRRDEMIVMEEVEMEREERGGPRHLLGGPMYRGGQMPNAFSNYAMMPQQLQQQVRYTDTRNANINLNAMSINKPYQEVEVFTSLQGTVEYEERQNYFGTLDQTIYQFWYDLAKHVKDQKTLKNFFSPNFPQIAQFQQGEYFMSIMTFIDLSFKKVPFQSKLEKGDLFFTPETPIICLTKEIIEEQGVEGEMKLMISQKFFDPQDKYTFNEEDPDLRFEKPVKEFVKGKVYESQVVVTNSTSTPLKVDVIMEIPRGSICISSKENMRVESITLNSLNSKSFEFKFYFPCSGEFGIYPATVSRKNEILGIAQIDDKMTVKDKKTITELKTMNDILSGGNLDDILNFIESKNLFNRNLFSFSSIYWLLRNKEFYSRVLPILKKKGIYDACVWSYSVYHKDFEHLSEYIQQNFQVQRISEKLHYFDCSLFKIDQFKLLEYYPLVNPRTFSLTQENKNNILNKEFKEQYTKFLQYLFFKEKMEQQDQLVLMNYLLAQDRIEDALNLHQKFDSSQINDKQYQLQYDYITAYLDFMNGYPNFTVAKEICSKYLSYPVLQWRNLFVEIANQLAEFEEIDLIKEQKDSDKKKSNKEKAKEQPDFNYTLKDSTILINYHNLKQIWIKAYKIDLEAYVSLNPFEKTSIRDYANVMPFFQQQLNLEQTQKQQIFEIPPQIASENLFIQMTIENQGVEKSQYFEYIPFELDYYVNEEFGILKLTDKETKKPVPKIYMKCFAKYKNSTIKFYKDGFTDLRGSFDYVSLNKDKVDDIEKFEVFVNAPGYGCKTLRINPPVKIGRVEGEAKKIISKNWKQKQMMPSQNRYNNVYF